MLKSDIISRKSMLLRGQMHRFFLTENTENVKIWLMKTNIRRLTSLLVACIMLTMIQVPIAFGSENSTGEDAAAAVSEPLQEEETITGSESNMLPEEGQGAVDDADAADMQEEQEPSEVPDAETESEESAEAEAGEPAAAGGVITGFVMPEQTEFCFEGEPSEEELVAAFPAALEVFLDGEEEAVSVPVSWEVVEDYDDTAYYFYSVKPVLPEDYSLADTLDPLVDVPWLTVFRQTTEEEIDEGEQAVDIPVPESEDLQTVYTEEEGVIPADETDGQVSLLRFLDRYTENSYAASNADKVYKYLTGEMGLNMAAACGVMTNLYAESGMQPNNLENRYNSAYGLSDAEYTKRVNKGKKNNGKYTSGNGSTRYFTTDYSGYGICQWTSLGRRKALLAQAVKKDVSIANLNMQLEFLKSELQNSYPQVWATLKGVPNNAKGAYLAAVHFCASFEIPANTNATAASRAKTALSTYWKTYSGKSASVSKSSYLGLCGYTYPGSVKKGKGMTCSGHVISNYRITSVSAKIINSKGKAVYSSTRKPSSTIYSLYNFDSSMLFGKLSAGSYTYQITAKDSKGNSVQAKHGFNVSAGAETVTLRGCAVKDTSSAAAAVTPVKTPTNAASTLRGVKLNYPKKLKKGKTFTIKGKVKSNYGLKKVTVMVKTKSGKKKLSASANLSGVKTYKIKNLDDRIAFGKLKKGTYYYIVKATDAKKSKQLLKKKFKVK